MTPVKKSALGQRPANQFEKKLVGIVEATVGEKKARFEFVQEDGKPEKTFLGGKPTLVVPLEDLPAFPKLTQAHTGKQFRIRMNSAGDEVDALSPVTGHYSAQLIDIGPTKKDEEPTPVEKVFGEGTPKESRYLEFFAVYKITHGAFKGVQMPGYYLHYKFEKDEDGSTRFAGNFDNKKATRLFQLFDWGKIHGLWDEPIKWDNVTILPELLSRAMDSDVTVDIIIKDGYIREILPSQDDEPFADPAEAPKAKRSVAEKKAELGFEVEAEVDDVDRDFPPEKPAKAKKPAKKVVEEESDDDL